MNSQFTDTNNAQITLMNKVFADYSNKVELANAVIANCKQRRGKDGSMYVNKSDIAHSLKLMRAEWGI